MSTYATTLDQPELDAFGGALDGHEPDERKPKPKKAKHKPIKCRQPACKREIVPDGYGEWVHADDWMYSCGYSSRDASTKDDVRVARR